MEKYTHIGADAQHLVIGVELDLVARVQLLRAVDAVRREELDVLAA